MEKYGVVDKCPVCHKPINVERVKVANKFEHYEETQRSCTRCGYRDVVDHQKMAPLRETDDTGIGGV